MAADDPRPGGTDAELIEWEAWERLLRERGVVIDRPRGRPHPRFPEMIYPLDYGYIPGTVGGDGAEVDVFVGSGDSGLTAALITHDLAKGDHELKLLWNTTEAEIAAVLAFLQRENMRVELRLR